MTGDINAYDQNICLKRLTISETINLSVYLQNKFDLAPIQDFMSYTQLLFVSVLHDCSIY